MINKILLINLLELKNLLQTSDDDGVRRQARGTLDALSVVVETTSTTKPLWRRISRTVMQSARLAGTSADTGQLELDWSVGVALTHRCNSIVAVFGMNLGHPVADFILRDEMSCSRTPLQRYTTSYFPQIRSV